MAAPLRNFRHMLQNARTCAVDGDEVVLDQCEGKESGKRGSRNIAAMPAHLKKPLGSQGYEFCEERVQGRLLPGRQEHGSG